MTYLAVNERAGRNYSAYVPDLPGCVASGSTAAVARRQMKAAMALHLDGMREDGLTIPKPSAKGVQVGVPLRSPARRRRKSAA